MTNNHTPFTCPSHLLGSQPSAKVNESHPATCIIMSTTSLQIIDKWNTARLVRTDKVKGLLNSFYLFCFVSSLFADGADQRATTLPIPRVVSRDLPTRLSPVHAYESSSRCRFSATTPRQLMIELFVLMSSPIPLRKSEKQCTPAETRTHKFRLSGRMLYPLDHGVLKCGRIFLHLGLR